MPSRSCPALTLQPAADTKFDDYKPKVAFFFPGQVGRGNIRPGFLGGGGSARVSIRSAGIQPGSEKRWNCGLCTQGAQTVGMCKEVAAELPVAKELFDRASEVLGYDLLAVCAEGEGSGGSSGSSIMSGQAQGHGGEGCQSVKRPGDTQLCELIGGPWGTESF